MKGSKQVVTLLVILAFLAIAALLIFLAFGTKTGTNINFGRKTDEQIRKQFDCDRITADVRETDIYCSYPELARGELPTIERIRLSMSCDDPPQNARANDYESCSDTQKYREQLRKYLR
ncbi:MAG: hypothetical protein U0526_02205 [Candidatus Saccharibacteria bacterium]